MPTWLHSWLRPPWTVEREAGVPAVLHPAYERERQREREERLAESGRRIRAVERQVEVLGRVVLDEDGTTPTNAEEQGAAKP